ncbi:MAG: WXG100 family type VII secretion target [Pseudonocardiaceae bacterium]
MSGFEVTTSELNAAQVYVCDVAGETRYGLTSLASDVEELLGGGWQGTAATAFAAGWQDWCTGGYEVLDALGRMAQLLAVTARTYDGTDTVSRLDFSRLDGTL